jgi:hypothetical protein
MTIKPATPSSSRPRLSRRTRWIIAIVALLIIGTAIAARPIGQQGSGAGSNPSVQWADYAPDLQSRIDGMRASKDCAGLQTEFNNADTNNAITMTRTGHNNAELMSYLDAQQRAAGCY